MKLSAKLLFIGTVVFKLSVAVNHVQAGTNGFYPGNFSLASSPGVGNNPCSVTAADLNGDGILDLICVYYNSVKVTELTNNGSAVFAPYASPSLTSGHSAIITVTNIDGHGLTAWICANGIANSVSVLTNSPGGLVVASTTPTGSYPYAVATADVNGDGSLDLITANERDGTLSVLTNNGSGTFVVSSTPSVGGSPYSVATADVNGDGKADLICANENTNTLSVLTNNGSGGFVLAYTLLVGHSPQSVIAVTNLDGHGLLALISASYTDGTLSVLTNNGNAGFSLAATLTVGGGPLCVTSADINADGLPDLISANFTSNSLTVLTNNGSGGFALCATLAVGSGPYSVIAADVNGDGHPDLICPNFNGNTLTVLTNSPSLPPPVTGFSPLSGSPGTSVTITGSNFTAVVSVTFNGANAGFTVNSTTQIVATVPPCASSGPITVANATGTTVTTSNFTFVKLPATVAAPVEADLEYALCNDSVVTFGFDGTIGITSTKMISSDVILDGTGHNVTISGSNAVSIFSVNPGVHLTLTNLTLVNGATPGNGGGIANNGGIVTIVNCTFSNDVAVGSTPGGPGQNGGNCSGGAIFNNGALIVNGSTFLHNAALGGYGAANSVGGGGTGGNGGTAAGGAIGNAPGASVAITNCTFYNNQAIGGNGGQGGSGFNGSTFTYQCGTYCCAHDAFGDCTEYCPLYCTGTNYGSAGGNGGNGGSCSGGSLYNNSGNVIIVNSTIYDGSSTGGAPGAAGPSGSYSSGSGLPGSPGSAGGGNITHVAGSFVLLNCIVAGAGNGGNYSGAAIIDAGNNLSSDASLSFTSPASITNTDPSLASLSENGGPTETMALLPGSPAVRAGNPSGAPSIDQRGQPRKALQIDIGAYETPIVVSEISSLLTWTRTAGTTSGGIASFRLNFTNTPGTSYSLWSSTNLSLSFSNWTFLGFPRETAPGQFQYTDSPLTNKSQNFYEVRSP